MSSKQRVRVKAGSRKVPFRMSTAPVLAGGGPLSVRRPYDAASVIGLGADWQTSNPGANAALASYGSILRARARDAYRQSGYASAIVDTLTTQAIGTGIKPMAKTPDRELNRKLDALFREQEEFIDADGVTDFYGLQAMVFNSTVVAGEAFARIRPRRIDSGLPVPFQIQLLESEFLPLSMNDNERRITMGIERNRIGRRTGYHFYRRHPEDLEASWDLDTVRIPADRVCHVFWPTRIGQLRGETWLTRALVAIMQMGDYQLSERVRKQNTAKLSLIIRRAAPDMQTAVEALADSQDEDLYEDDLSDEEGVAGWTPGTALVLEGAEDVQVSQSADVGGQYEAYVKVQMREIARSCGLLYEQLSGDWTAISDRTLRVALQEFRRKIEQLQWHMMVYQFCRPVWRHFIDYALASGKITLPAGMTMEEAYRVEWTPPEWPYIHPVQDVDADIKKMEAKLTSRKRLLSERGENIEEIDAEIAEDREREADMGLSPDREQPPEPDEDYQEETQ